MPFTNTQINSSMQTKRKILESRYFDFELGSEDHMYDVMDAWAKPAVDALRIIQKVYIPEILKLYDVEGSIPKELKKLISEALKQYNQ